MVLRYLEQLEEVRRLSLYEEAHLVVRGRPARLLAGMSVTSRVRSGA